MRVESLFESVFNYFPMMDGIDGLLKDPLFIAELKKAIDAKDDQVMDLSPWEERSPAD